jgi:predicted DNA-binding protein with PD1-like motif
MKIQKQSENEFFGRFEENEELVSKLTEFLQENNIQTGIFSIIGSLKASRIAFYDQRERKYLEMPMDEAGEILHCTGNISLKDGKPFPHCHITLGARDGSAYGGHLMAGKFFVAEVYIKKLDKPVERKLDEGTGLSLLEP